MTDQQTKTEDDVDNLIDAVAPEGVHRTQTVRGLDGTPWAEWERTYTQRPLSLFPKIEFTRLVGRALKKALKNGIKLSELTNINADALRTAGEGEESGLDGVVDAFFVLLEESPELLKDIYAVSLGVPKDERPIVFDIWDTYHDPVTGQGGLSDEDGVEILNTFIRQNMKAIREIVMGKLRETGELIAQAFTEEQPKKTSRKRGSSKPSKRTPQTTRKA